MSQKGPFNCVVTNGDATVTATGQDFLTSIAAGQWFSKVLSGVSYQIASVTDNNNFELTAVYAGATDAAASGVVQTSYTTNYSFPKLERNDIETATLFGRFAEKLDTLLGTALVTAAAGAILFAGAAGAITADAAKFSWDDANGAMTIASGTQTTSHPLLNLTQTWNAGGVTFRAISLNVTNTASAAASLLADLQVGGTSQWRVDRGGAVTQLGALSIADQVIEVTSNPMLNITQSWNAGGVTFRAISLNITNNASAAASLLADLQVGGTSQWRVDRTGTVTQLGGLAVTGAITGASYNGNTITTGTGVLTIAAGKTLTANSTLTLAGTDGKTLTVSKSLTLDGTDGTVMTFPSTSATIARTDAANTFTGVQTMTSPAITTSITTGSTTFTAWAGATTLLTIGGTGASAVFAIPGTLDATGTTGALTVAGGAYIAKQLIVAGTGPHAIGGATNALFQLLQTGSYTVGTSVIGLGISPTLAPGSGGDAYGFSVGAGVALTLNKFSSGTHADFASAIFSPATIGAGAAALTNASTVKVTGAPSVGTNLRAFWVSAGWTQFDGGVGIGGNAVRAGTAGTNLLDIFNGTAPTSTLSNGISLYSTSGELRVMDSAGNATLLSPHDKKTNEWVYDSVDTRTGRRLHISMERLMKAVNDHFGWDFVRDSALA